MMTTNRRQALRFEKVFPVIVSSDTFGDINATARNVSAYGILLELPEPLPLGSEVRILFWMPDSQARIVARGLVKNHYFLNFADADGPRAMTGMAVRFTEFDTESNGEPDGGPLGRLRILH
jgi:hypothetical protein